MEKNLTWDEVKEALFGKKEGETDEDGPDSPSLKDGPHYPSRVALYTQEDLERSMGKK